MHTLAAFVSISLLSTSFLATPGPASHGHGGAIHGPEVPASRLTLVFDTDAKAPDVEAALEAIPGSKVSDPTGGPELWSLDAPEGFFFLGEIPYGENGPSPRLSMDLARFTGPQLARIDGELLTLGLFTDLGDAGLPGLHIQIKELVAAAKSLGLGDPIALVDLSADRWHPPGWVARMAKSEAGPAPSTTFQVHSVYDKGADGKKRMWIHSHGIARISGYELGCVDVREQHLDALAGVMEVAASFAVDDVEWPAGEPTQVVYGLELVRAPWQEAVPALAPKVAGKLEDFDPDHDDMFILAVQEEGKLVCPGEAATALEQMVGARSNRETERGALAARETYASMRTWQRSTQMDHAVMVKSPVETEEGDREHCWFEVTRLRRSSVKAVLLSKPWGTADIAPGDEVTLKVANLTGWMVQTEEANYGPDELEALLAASFSEDD